MSDRSLRVHPDWIETVKSRYQSRYARQKDLAQDAEIGSVDTVNKFLNGKPINRENFWRLCDLLQLAWEVITNDKHSSKQPSSASTKVRNSIPSLLSSAGDEGQSELHRINSVLENPNFIGREQEIGYLGHLSSQDYKCILLLAPGGVGKTTLARHFLKQQFGTYIEFAIAKEQQNIASAASLVEEKLRQLGEEPGREFYVSLERLKYKLQMQRIGVLVDNLEPALNEHGQFLHEHQEYVDLLRVLCDPSLQSLTLITSREPLYESLDIHTLLLPSLSLDDWEIFFTYYSIQIDLSTLSELHRAYDGNALAMKVLCNPIKQFYNGNITAYWHDCKTETDLLVEKAVENLIKEQFNRLQRINLGAYHLLCRMGCYRYQDVQTVPLKGLFCLLWDVPESKKRLVDTLIRCSLVECKNNQYALHPIIRAEAIARLRASEDWEIANRKAAEFWTTSVNSVETLDNALTALESYYHYIAISDFEQAGDVIIKPRTNKWVDHASLGVSLYRLGWLKHAISIIDLIVDKISNSYQLSKIYNILGDLYWLTGFVHKAIECHNKSGEIADIFLKSLPNYNEEAELLKFANLKLWYLINIGICKIDLGEFEEAAVFFQEAISFSKFINSNKELLLVNNAFFCLAFLYSALGFHQQASIFAEKVISSESKESEWSRGYKYIFLGLAYKNMMQIENSFEAYRKALSYAEESHYTQAKAKVLFCLGELYREQKDFENALLYIKKSIEILNKISAKCDLAEACFQLGLTYQAIGEVTQSWEYRDKAIQIFIEMDAPRQVERVKQAFGNSM